MSRWTELGSDRELRTGVMNAGFRWAQSFLLNIISVPAMAVIIRKLGTSGYGEWMTATSLVGTAAFLTSLGLRAPFIRGIARDPSAAPVALAEQMGARITLTLFASVLTLLACLCLNYDRIITGCALIACAALFMTVIANTFSDYLEARQKFGKQTGIALIAGLILTGASVIVALYSGGAIAISLAYLIGPAISLVLLACVVTRDHFRVRINFNLRRSIEMLWTSRHFTAQQLIFMLNRNLTFLVLPKVIGTSSFGVFAAGTLLFMRGASLPDAIGTAFYPMISDNWHRDRDATRRRIWLGIALSAGLCLLAAAAIFPLSQWISEILFPRRGTQCELVMRITIWALPLLGIETMLGYALNGVGKEAVQARASLYAAICSVAVAAALIWIGGLVGACWALVARSVIQIGFLAMPFFSAVGIPGVRRAQLSAHLLTAESALS